MTPRFVIFISRRRMKELWWPHETFGQPRYKFCDICLIVWGKKGKIIIKYNWPNMGSNPKPNAWKTAALPLFHTDGMKFLDLHRLYDLLTLLISLYFLYSALSIEKYSTKLWLIFLELNFSEVLHERKWPSRVFASMFDRVFSTEIVITLYSTISI